MAVREIRTQINSIKNTQKITRAMEMVAASKMRKAQDRMLHAKPYAKKILQVIGHLANAKTEYQHPYLVNRPIKNIGMIIVTTDRGLCGGLNGNLLKQALVQMKSWKEQNVSTKLCIIGTKGEAFFKRFGGQILAKKSHLGDAPSASSLIGAIKVMLDAFLEGEIDALYLCSNEFVTTMQQTPHIQQLLPVLPVNSETTTEYWDYIYEPDSAREILGRLLNRYIESQVYRGVIENIACEQAARMVAMKSATDNAGELINDLNLIYNKARQAGITRELSEIVAGAQEV